MRDSSSTLAPLCVWCFTLCTRSPSVDDEHVKLMLLRYGKLLFFTNVMSYSTPCTYSPSSHDIVLLPVMFHSS